MGSEGKKEECRGGRALGSTEDIGVAEEKKKSMKEHGRELECPDIEW
ncbi:hypothetical protein NYE70_24000 [Paenibacillus sp. FSL R5-0407]